VKGSVGFISALKREAFSSILRNIVYWDAVYQLDFFPRLMTRSFHSL